tara:strand:- start:109 stop:510 length:402 start_codon:yes stop_codon:yes gene_type:complete
MNDITDFYKDFTKTNIINGLQKYLNDNKMHRKRSDGFGRDKGNGLERPVIENETYSWTQFKKLPKDVIIVYAFMKGCKLPYLKNLKDTGWFTKKKDLREKRATEGWVSYYHMGQFVQKPPDFRLKNEYKPKEK